jgi:hypothetical protein
MSYIESITVTTKKKKNLRTRSLIEGEKLRNVRIYELIDEDVYEDKKSDNDDVDSQGDKYYLKDGNTYYRLIKDGDNFTEFADEELQKELQESGKLSLKRNLADASGDAIAKKSKELGLNPQTHDPFFWMRQEEMDVDISFVEDLKDVVSNIGFNEESLSPEGVPLLLEAKNRRQKYDNLYYPETIATSKQDRIIFTMKYIAEARDFEFNFEQNDPLVVGKRKTEKGIIEGSVTLPIPGGIYDTNNVDFNTDSLNAIDAAGFGFLLNPGKVIGGAINSMSDLLKATPEQLRDIIGSNEGGNIISALRVKLAETGMGKRGMLSRLGGGILNPNMELLFQAPGMRTFKFSFTMSARSRGEATQIKKIIRFFKQGMSVKTSSQKLFLVTPNLFEIKYKTGEGEDHPSIGKILDCALVSLNTSYGDGSTYMTFDDPARTMTTYKIDMLFNELDPITSDNYDDEDTNIGY